MESVIDWEKLGYDRQYYRQNRAQILAKQRMYREQNQHKIKRRRRIYNRQLKMGRKPRKRMGAPGAGYTFISQGGAKFEPGSKW